MGDSIPSNLTAAENIYGSGFSTIWNTAKNDPGHPTLYPMLIALVWAVFGKSLAVTHALQVLAGLTLVLVTGRVAHYYFGEKTAKLAPLLLCISPFYVAQLTGASLQLPLTALAFTGFFFLLKEKPLAACLALSAMMLVHLQGAYLLLFIFITDLAYTYLNKGFRYYPAWIKARWWVYGLPFAVFVLWGWAHYNHAGWAFSSPNYLRESPGLKGILYNFAIAFWRIADFGYVFLLAVLVIHFVRKGKLYFGSKETQALVAWLLMVAIVGGGICISFAYPPIHRYFLGASVLLVVLFGGIVQQKKGYSKMVITALAGIFLVVGNFMYYPGKCIGDANIAYLPVYQLEKEIQKDFPPGTEFYTYAPLSYPASVRYLDSAKGVRMKELYYVSPDSVTYILQSNMNCEFSAEELEKLEGWHGTSYEMGGIYVNIYANPARVLQKPKGWHLRQPSAIERRLLKLKEKTR